MGFACQSSPEDSCSSCGDGTVPYSSGRGSTSRWSTLSWDAPSDLLSPPTPDPGGALHLDSDSRPSSGFYSVSGSSLSDSSYSVSSDAAQGGLLPPARPQKLWEQLPISADNTDILWSDGAVQQQQAALHISPNDADLTEETVLVSSDLDVTGLGFLSDLCSGLSHSLISSLQSILDPVSSSSTHQRGPKLDHRYCTDLVSRRTKEVYPYPSPLHAVALQSPLFTSQNQEHSASLSPEGAQSDEPPESTPSLSLQVQPQQPTKASFTQLEQYISRLAHQYHSQLSSNSDLTSAAAFCPVTQRGLCIPGKGCGSTQSLSAFESRSTPSTLGGACGTPCKSLLGNSARVSLSTTGKKATRNSINLGNLPSASGEDLNINLHLNLNLNLTPGLNSNRGLVDASRNGSCGNLGNDIVTRPTTSATALSSSTPTPALRPRPRISTCPSSLSHRSSLEVTSGHGASSGFGSTAICRSLDWSSGASAEAGAAAFGSTSESAPGSQRSSFIQETSCSPKLNEDSHMVGEISRLSGLSKAVVVGLLEQGVELDVDCFRADVEGEVRNLEKSQPAGQTDQCHDHTRLIDLNPQRPIKLSLSVTHSPQSQSSLTPPLSHSNSPMHPYQSAQAPSGLYSSYFHQTHSPSDLPSSTASSPASRPTQRGRSPPRPLQPSPLGATPLSVFRRDAPFQCSLPRANTRTAPSEHGAIHPRGGSLRQSGGGSEGSGGWRRMEGDGLYKGKHVSHKLIRAATVSSYARREDYCSVWGEEMERERTVAMAPRKTANKLCRAFEGNLWGKESESEREEMDRAEYGYGWGRYGSGSWRREHRRAKAASSSHGRRPKVESSPMFAKKRGKEDGERRSSSLRLSRRALFRSESQGLLVPRNQSQEPTKRAHWVSSFDVGHSDIGVSKDEGVRLLRAKEDKGLSSTASLFNLSRSQSLEGSSHSLSPLSSPSLSPSPPPRMALQRSRSLRDLGRKVFGSMRSLSLKRKPSKK